MIPRALILAGLLAVASAAGADPAILSFHTPTHLAGEDGCSEGSLPLDSISLIELWRMDSVITLERSRPPAVPPGEEETLAVSPGSEQVTYFVTTRRLHSRSSCRSPYYTFNGRVDVQPVGAPRADLPWLGLPRPNPSGGLVAISWCLPVAARLRLEVMDIAGRVVARPEDGDHAAGVHVSLWDARRAAPGIYLVRARSGDWAAVRRLLVLH